MEKKTAFERETLRKTIENTRVGGSWHYITAQVKVKSDFEVKRKCTVHK